MLGGSSRRLFFFLNKCLLDGLIVATFELLSKTQTVHELLFTTFLVFHIATNTWTVFLQLRDSVTRSSWGFLPSMWCALRSPGVSRDPADLVSMVTIFLRRKHTCYLSVPLGITLFSELSVSVCFSHQVFHRLSVAWSITAVLHCVFAPVVLLRDILQLSLQHLLMLSSSCLFAFCAALSPDASNNSEGMSLLA